jgi:hypothetical protein
MDRCGWWWVGGFNVGNMPPSPQFWGNMMPPSPQFWGNMMQRRDGLGILGVSFEITAEIYARPIFDVTGCCAGWG